MWPFRRKSKPSPPQDRRVWNEDWAPGDLAECIVDASVWTSFNAAVDPGKGDVLRVVEVREGTLIAANVLVIGLAFEGKPAGLYWECSCFRKLRPVQAPAEAEFTAWMRDLTRQPEHVQ